MSNLGHMEEEISDISQLSVLVDFGSIANGMCTAGLSCLRHKVLLHRMVSFLVNRGWAIIAVGLREFSFASVGAIASSSRVNQFV
eukprot:1918514-Amphidinium_carterae.1